MTSGFFFRAPCPAPEIRDSPAVQQLLACLVLRGIRPQSPPALGLHRRVPKTETRLRFVARSASDAKVPSFRGTEMHFASYKSKVGRNYGKTLSELSFVKFGGLVCRNSLRPLEYSLGVHHISELLLMRRYMLPNFSKLSLW
jgi:hypothetical protein